MNNSITRLKPLVPDDTNCKVSAPTATHEARDTESEAKESNTIASNSTASNSTVRNRITSSRTASHSTASNNTTANNAASSSTHMQKSNCQQSVGEHATILRYNYLGVIEWILPYNLSQLQILGQFFGSNACAIISVIGAIKLASGMTIPSNMNELSSCINNFACTM